MKVLHTVALLEPSSGVVNQMKWEQQAADRLGLDWESNIFSNSTASFRSISFKVIKKIIDSLQIGGINNAFKLLILRYNFYKWLKSKEDICDAYILWHSLYDIQQLIFLRQTKKRVYLVHHTLEIAELSLLMGWRGKIKVMLECWLGKYSIRSAHTTVGVTQEIIDYEKKRANQPNKPSVLYPNGVMCEGLLLNDKRGVIPEIIFIASYFFPWHGLDLLLAVMKKNSDIFVLHLIGGLSPEDEIIALEDNRIIVHGHIDSQSIREISEKCWLGLASFALYRKNMQEACTLKVREYLAMGIPVFSGYRDIFPPNFSYYTKSELSVENILRLSYEHRNVTREQIASESHQFIDKIELLRCFSEKLKS